MDLSAPKMRLDMREGLPEALRVLVENYPREAWESHKNFSGLARFWLDRHIMFRKTIAHMLSDSAAFLDQSDDQYAPKLHRITEFFLNQLHTHHSIEDHHLFPTLEKFDKRLLHGFELLDADHKELDENIALLATRTNAVFANISEGSDPKKAVSQMREIQLRFDKFLHRHLGDEEELVVPVILEYGVSDSQIYGS